MDKLSTDTLAKIREYVTLHRLAYLLGSILVVKLIQWLYLPVRRLFSPLGRLPGPKRESLIWGNLKQLLSSSNLTIYEQWAETYGPTFAYQGLFSSYRLVSLDIRALNLYISLNPEVSSKL
ncbi:hypothetical protein FS749_003867 [Ceratobasidium sp. UAMH 11750]|nr:hypothetical protein FS749_003867 [Ceratobasidium sp. UAMH 11750]